MSSANLSAPSRFRALLAGKAPILVPGAYDALSARVIEDAGFDAVYLGGFAAGASSLGIPDHSLITMTEILEVARKITSAVDVPVIADLDDAGGNAVNVCRFVRAAEGAGLAGIHIEDVVAGKHFSGHPDTYVDAQTFGNRIRAATDARIDDDFLIIARSDATDIENITERGVAAVEAGADMVFFPYLRRRDAQRVQRECNVPMLRIGSSQSSSAESGAKVVIFPAHTLVASFNATREIVRRLRNGRVDSVDEPLMTELNRILGSPMATSLAEQYGVVSTTRR